MVDISRKLYERNAEETTVDSDAIEYSGWMKNK